ncbi:MAG: helix-turn-helix domain-containing protein [bacterium]|nr:helix-turn-helix domain-containing protein [bacterium]
MVNLGTEIKKLGLSDKEAKVYLAVLELGQAPAAEIAAHSGVVRVTAYVVLEELRKKGLVSTFLKAKKTIFAAEPPERLKNLFEIEEHRVKESFSDLKKILPDLSKLYESRGEHPKARLFEGSEGIDSLREDILKTKTKFLYQILPLDIIAKSPSERKFQDEKVKKLYNISSKSIYYNKKGKIFPGKLGKAEYKFLADKFETEIIIYGEKIAFINAKKKPTGIIIDDFSISQTIKIFFEALWKLLK